MLATLESALHTGRLDVTASVFLCSALPGWEMPSSMHAFVAKQDLVITKGDANYRRLAGDLHWDYDVELKRVLQWESRSGCENVAISRARF